MKAALSPLISLTSNSSESLTVEDNKRKNNRFIRDPGSAKEHRRNRCDVDDRSHLSHTRLQPKRVYPDPGCSRSLRNNDDSPNRPNEIFVQHNV